MSAFLIFFLQIKKKTFENLPVADSQVYVRTVEALLMFFMQIKNELSFAYCLWHKPSHKKTIQPQVLTSSGLFPLVFNLQKLEN
jgi:hypothetical protein